MTIDKLDPKGLKPCPLCQSTDIREGYIRDGRQIFCGACDCSVRAFNPDATAEAVAKWNRRASTAGVPGETPRVTEAKPIGYAIADYFEDRRAEYEQNGTVIYAAPAGMATTPVYLSSPPVSQQAEAVDLDSRMKAAGMIPLSDLIGGNTPLERWTAHTGVSDLAKFEQWLEMRQREFGHMVAGYELGDKDKADELYEWVHAHFSALNEVAANLRQMKRRMAEASPAPDAVEPVAWARMKTLDPSKPLKATTIKDIADGWMKAGHKVKPLVIRSALHTSPVSAPGMVEPVPAHECRFMIGQPVHLASPYPEMDPNAVFYVTGISWEHRMGPARGWNITVAGKEDIEKGYGQTDGYSPDDLLPARSPAVVEGK